MIMQADVFAQNASGSVQAITASGKTAWTTPSVSGQLIPDFQGGAIVYTGGGIYRLDGMTGQPSSWTYTSASGNNLTQPVPHTEGTIFTLDGSTVVGINPGNGQTFTVQMENSIFTFSQGCTNFCESPLPQSQEGWSVISPPLIGSLIIAGDGYAYVPYAYTVSAGSSANSGCGCGCWSTGESTQSLRLLRIGPNGDASEIEIGDFSSGWSSYDCDWQGSGAQYSATATVPTLITNADQGVLASYSVTTSTSSSAATLTYYLATTSGTGVSIAPMSISDQQAPVQPVLQRADGSYIGTVSTSTANPMIAFTSSGNTLWMGPNDTPQIATADGGVIGASGTTYDANGNVTGQIANMPTYSWKGAYQLGSADSVVPGLDIAVMAATYAATRGGNLTGNGFSLVHHTFGLFFCNTGTGGDGPCPKDVSVTNMAFSYLPNIDNNNYKMACDFSKSSQCDSNTAHPEWVETIKLQALKSFTAAFASLPAIVSKGNTPTMLNNSTTLTPFEHTVYVDGSWRFTDEENLRCPATGYTSSKNVSFVYYLSVMCAAQVSLGQYGTSEDFTPPFSDTVNFQRLVTAIGKGIGNIAAHETGHQYSFFTKCITSPVLNMDCGTEKKHCQYNVNSVYEFYHADDWDFLDSPPIHWQPENQDILATDLLNGASCLE
jgi:hypothetical protein